MSTIAVFTILNLLACVEGATKTQSPPRTTVTKYSKPKKGFQKVPRGGKIAIYVICAIIGVIVTLVIIWLLIRKRRNKAIKEVQPISSAPVSSTYNHPVVGLNPVPAPVPTYN